MSERMLIVKVLRVDQTRADLFAKGHRWPDLKLFDLGELAAVGMDPQALPIGQEQPCRFWAVWEESEKLNKSGRPYRDILTLEPIDKPATTTSTDNTALLAELRAIRALLQVMAEAQGLEIPPTGAEGIPEAGDNDLDAHFPRYQDGSPVSDNPAEVRAYQRHMEATGNPPVSLAELRAWALANRNGSK